MAKAVVPSDFNVVTGNVTSSLIKEFKFPNIYLHHNYTEAKPNQLELIAGSGPGEFGKTVVNSWEIYDGVGPNAQLVAHAQGLHIHAQSWHNSFTMVFEVERFKESTLQVMGSSIEKEGEWAIVGGTGVFSMANGVIKRTVHKKRAEGDILELAINGYVTLIFPTAAKSVLWGIKGKDVHDIKTKPWRLQSVTVRSNGHVIHGLFFTYIDQTGKTHNAGCWGNVDPSLGGPALGGKFDQTLKLGPSEYVKEVSGIQGTATSKWLQTIKLVTNERTFGPFGGSHAKPTHPTYTTTTSVPKEHMIVGFHATSETSALTSLGVYSIPQKFLFPDTAASTALLPAAFGQRA